METSTLQLPFLINENIYKSDILQGTVIIPDMSGFSRFVETTDFETGKLITSKLLNAILKSNVLNLQVSEIEGDAVLFYKYGKKISAKHILHQFCLMKEVFDQELKFLEEEFELNIDLSLKLIAHYGPLAQYQIGKFEKLYGQTIIEAHKLLKNSVASNTYALLTDALLDNEENKELNKRSRYVHNTICEVYEDFKKICYTFFDFEQEPCRNCLA